MPVLPSQTCNEFLQNPDTTSKVGKYYMIPGKQNVRQTVAEKLLLSPTCMRRSKWFVHKQISINMTWTTAGLKY